MTKPVLKSKMPFQTAVLLHSARVVKSMHPSDTYRFPDRAVAVLQPDGDWFIYAPQHARGKRRLLVAGTSSKPKPQTSANSNILSEDEQALEALMAQTHKERSRSRLVPPELEPNIIVLLHGSVSERYARQQLMRDYVRGKRAFSEAEGIEFRMLDDFIKIVERGVATEEDMQ